MADEEQEEVNEFVKAAESWDNDPNNSFESFQANTWDLLFDPATAGDWLDGYSGSTICKAINTIVPVEKLSDDSFTNNDVRPINTPHLLYPEYTAFRERRDYGDDESVTSPDTAFLRGEFAKSIYTGSPNYTRGFSGFGHGGTYNGKRRSCKAIADLAYENYRAKELFNELVQAPLSQAVKREGADAIKCALKIQERAGDLARMIELFEKESFDPVQGIFPDQTAMLRVLYAPPEPYRQPNDPLLAKIGFTSKNEINADYLKNANVADAAYTATGQLQPLNNITLHGNTFQANTIEGARDFSIKLEDVNESVQKDILAAEAFMGDMNMQRPIILYDPTYANATTRANNIIVPDMIEVDPNNIGRAYAANNTMITYAPVTTTAGPVRDFPYYWSSVVARMITVAKAVQNEASTAEAFTSASLAKIASGQNVGDSLDLLFDSNHGNGLLGTMASDSKLFTDASDRGKTLYDMLNVGEYNMSPSNSDIRFIIETYTQQGASSSPEERARNAGLDLNLEGLTDKYYTLSGWCEQTMEAATLIREYPWEQVTAGLNSEIPGRYRAAADWLYLRASWIKEVADEMAEASQCILDADEELTEEAWELQDEFKQALGDNETTLEVPFWFDKQVQDRARNAAIAAQSLELDDLDKINADLSGVSKAERALFKEQCFLLSYIGYFSKEKKNRLDFMYKSGNTPVAGGIHKRLPYTDLSSAGIPQPKHYKDTDLNASLMVDGDPYGFISKLTQSPRYGALYDIDHWHLSALQPKIRLFKVIYDFAEEDDTVIEKEVEISFDSHFSKDELDLFKSSRSRGAGVGLKSFEFTYDGSNPFAAKKSIKANLKIFASTFNELFVERTGDCAFADPDKPKNTKYGKENYRYVDLALKTLTKEKHPDQYNEWKAIIDENEKLAKLNFRLKAVVGWTSPKGNLPDDLHSDKNPHGRYNNEELKGALADSFVTLNLTPTVHNFEFDEQGRVIMNINYLAYVEDFFDQTAFNVFADPTGRVGFIREKRKLQMKALRSSCEYDDAGDNDKTLQDLEEEYANSVDKEIKESIQSIMKTLMDKDKVYFISLEHDKINSHTALGPYVDIKDVVSPPVNGSGNTLILNSDDYEKKLAATISDALNQLQPGDDGYEEQSALAGDENLIAAALAATNPYNYFLGFFYVSDLVDTVLENIEKELKSLDKQFKDLDELEYVEDAELKRRKVNLKKFERNFKRLRILLGPVEFIEYKRSNGNIQDSSFVNFGDIPVSVKYFVEFLTDRALSREDSFYSLTSFLNDFFNNLISNFLNNKKCFAFSTAQRVRVNQSTITSFNDTEDPDEITSLILKKAKTLKNNKNGNPARISLHDTVVSDHQRNNKRKGKKIRPILNISGRGQERKYIPINNEINYFTFFAGRVQPVERMNGNKVEDHENGIFHYLLGRDRGLVKNISLSKTETPGLQEVRFEQEGYEGLEQLRVVYDADIECYSNVNTFPGTYIYIDPKGFDPSLAKDFDITKYGVGGYYMIIKSTHRFAAGEAKSKIHAKWVAQLHTSFPVESVGKISDSTPQGSAYECKRAVDRLSRLQNSEDNQ